MTSGNPIQLSSPPPTEGSPGVDLATAIDLAVKSLSLNDRLMEFERAQKRAREELESEAEGRAPFNVGVRWYLGGLAAVGGSLGLFAGWSSSPVVSTLLPILFGLVGAGGGYFLSVGDLSSTRAKVLAFGLLAFVLPTVPAAMVGVSMRTETGLFDLFPRLSTPAESMPELPPGERNAEYGIRLAKLRASLVGLNSPAKERDRIIADATKVLVAGGNQRTIDTVELTAALRSLAAAFSTLAAKASGEHVDQLTGFGRAIATTADEMEVWGTVPASQARQAFITRLDETATLVRNSQGLLLQQEAPAGTLAPQFAITLAAINKQNALATARGATAAEDLLRLMNGLSTSSLPAAATAGRSPSSVVEE